jgi:hypothetical protein
MKSLALVFLFIAMNAYAQTAGVVLPGGAGHFIAVLSESPDLITIGDPLKGKLVLTKAEIKAAYHFTGCSLAIRTRS